MSFLGKGSYGEVYDNDNGTVTKRYYSTGSFFKELFYMSFFKNCKNICQIKNYNSEKKIIIM